MAGSSIKLLCTITCVAAQPDTPIKQQQHRTCLLDIILLCGSHLCSFAVLRQSLIVHVRCRAVWTSGRSVRTRFTVESDILQVCTTAAGN
jgi:hypothetical protein